MAQSQGKYDFGLLNEDLWQSFIANLPNEIRSVFRNANPKGVKDGKYQVVFEEFSHFETACEYIDKACVIFSGATGMDYKLEFLISVLDPFVSENETPKEDWISSETYTPPQDISEAYSLLPAWFVPRMMEDNWCFGLMMSNGTIICIETLKSVYQSSGGGLWIDVELMTSEPYSLSGKSVFYALTPRAKASLNLQHIVAAFEISD